jgi:hypothetical protein
MAAVDVQPSLNTPRQFKSDGNFPFTYDSEDGNFHFILTAEADLERGSLIQV